MSLPFEKATGWDSEPVGTLLEKCLLFLAGNRTAILGIVTTGHFICVCVCVCDFVASLASAIHRPTLSLRGWL